MRVACLTVFAAFYSLISFGADIDQTVADLLQNIRADLPKGWTATYEKEYACLNISRDEPVLGSVFVINGPLGGDKPTKRELSYGFRINPAISPQEYQRLSAANDRISEKTSALYDELVKRKVSRKFDSFLPDTEADKADVARYNALKKSRHDLPDLYYRDISLSWLYNSPDAPPGSLKVHIEDNSVRAECERVRDNFLKLLTKYKAGN